MCVVAFVAATMEGGFFLVECENVVVWEEVYFCTRPVDILRWVRWYSAMLVQVSWVTIISQKMTDDVKDLVFANNSNNDR